MRIRQLEYFITVCETGSLTRAAQLLHVAQPALGVQITALEDELGARLLNRTRRGVTATEAGELFLGEARHIVGRLTDVRRKVRQLDAPAAPTVTLGLTPSLTSLLTSTLLEALAARVPAIKVQIFEEFSHTLLDRVTRGQLDLALAYSVEAARFPEREPLLNETLLFVCSPDSPFAADRDIESADLVRAPYVMPSERDFVRQVVEQTMRRNKQILSIAYQVESMQAMKELIMQGKACGILPYGTVVRELRAKQLFVRRIVNPAITRMLYAVHAPRRTIGEHEAAVLTVIRSLLPALCRDSPSWSLATA
jgi:LysR family transcriptional regulator, nitrogen assimilation regulatory protein